MTHFEYMEFIGQTNIFEFLEPSTIIEGFILIDDLRVITKADTVIGSMPLRDKTLYLINVYEVKYWMYATEVGVYNCFLHA